MILQVTIMVTLQEYSLYFTKVQNFKLHEEDMNSILAISSLIGKHGYKKELLRKLGYETIS